MTKESITRFLNVFLILALVAILLGAYGVQFIKNEKPCPLCMLQRLGMLGVALGAVLNLRFGAHTEFYAFSLLSCVVGGSVALRQIALHVCPQFPTFGEPLFGLSLYTWSFVIFVSCVGLISLLLFLYEPTPKTAALPTLNRLEKIAIFALIFITAANVVTSFIQCGIGPCGE